jgi:hypothetical protein
VSPVEPVPEAPVAPEPIVVRREPAKASASAPVLCGTLDLTVLEPEALLGKLTEGQVACLEELYASDARRRKKASGMLMANAWASSDREGWERLILRHLLEVDDDDPDLCYKYALHLSKQGPARAAEVVRWAEQALANRTLWRGDTYTSRVYSLYKVRAAASQSLWHAAEQDRDSARAQKYRALTARNAQEWYEFARSSSKDLQTARALCLSAGGDCS